MRIYLDACILIYRLEGPDAVSRGVARMIETAADAAFCTSDLARLECLVDPIRKGDVERRRAYEFLFRGLPCVALAQEVYELAAELRALRALRTADAIHGAAAIAHGCGELWTNDRRLSSLSDRITIRIVPGGGA